MRWRPLGGEALFGGVAVEPGARGEVGAALPGAAPGAELVRCGEAGADDPGTAAESGGGSVPGAATVEEAEVTVVEDDGRSNDVDVGLLAG